MRHTKVLAVMMVVASLSSSCLKESTNCPNCPRGTTGSRGNVIFFTKTSCSDDSPFTVVVDDSINVTVTVGNVVPDCTTAGVVPLSLKTGAHKWRASCSAETLYSGTINISAHGCLVKEIK
jgi:hypothetical protein